MWDGNVACLLSCGDLRYRLLVCLSVCSHVFDVGVGFPLPPRMMKRVDLRQNEAGHHGAESILLSVQRNHAMNVIADTLVQQSIEFAPRCVVRVHSGSGYESIVAEREGGSWRA